VREPPAHDKIQITKGNCLEQKNEKEARVVTNDQRTSLLSATNLHPTRAEGDTLPNKLSSRGKRRVGVNRVATAHIADYQPF